MAAASGTNDGLEGTVAPPGMVCAGLLGLWAGDASSPLAQAATGPHRATRARAAGSALRSCIAEQASEPSPKRKEAPRPKAQGLSMLCSSGCRTLHFLDHCRRIGRQGVGKQWHLLAGGLPRLKPHHRDGSRVVASSTIR